MRVAVVSDTHLPRDTRALPSACIREIERADLVLHAGDFVRLSVLRELERRKPVEAVHGNMDEPALQAVLPERRVVDVEGRRIGMIHDGGPRSGRAERLAAMFPECNAIVYGHTHEPEIASYDDCLILNPGSPTERRRSPTRAMLVLDAEQGDLRARLVTLP